MIATYMLEKAITVSRSVDAGEGAAAEDVINQAFKSPLVQITRAGQSQ